MKAQEQKPQPVTYKKQLEDEVMKNLPGQTPVFTLMSWGKKNKFILCTVEVGCNSPITLQSVETC